MIEAKLFRAEGVVEVLPSGALKAVDFEQLAALVDPFIEAKGELKGLMIVADRFPGWDSLGALIEHVRFVREHQKLIRRVATVSDGATLTILPLLAKHFVKAEVRHFPFAQRDAAMEWLRQAP
jgi:SpoIIAA-like